MHAQLGVASSNKLQLRILVSYGERFIATVIRLARGWVNG
jgi:hypothetical protein